jgi:hypothetical protein
MKRLPVAALIGLVLAEAGCRNTSDKVESELRARNVQVRNLREEVDRCGAYNQALQQELATLRGEGVTPLPGENPLPSYPIRSLTLGRGTGGLDEDRVLGDEALQVVIQPIGAEGRPLLVPGSAVVQVVEFTPEGMKRPLSSWQIEPGQLKSSWKSGLLMTGYVLTLPWKVWPTSEKLRVVVQFRTNDGRMFEAEKDVTVRLSPTDRRDKPTPEGPPAPNDQLLAPPRQEKPPAAANVAGPKLISAQQAGNAAETPRP